MFRYACLLEDGEPVDPTVFVTAVPDWYVGDTFLTRYGEQFEIVDVQMPPEGAEDLNGVWTVRPVK